MPTATSFRPATTTRRAMKPCRWPRLDSTWMFMPSWGFRGAFWCRAGRINLTTAPCWTPWRCIRTACAAWPLWRLTHPRPTLPSCNNATSAPCAPLFERVRDHMMQPAVLRTDLVCAGGLARRLPIMRHRGASDDGRSRDECRSAGGDLSDGARSRAIVAEELAGAGEAIYLADLAPQERADALRRAGAVLANDTSKELHPGESSLIGHARLLQFSAAGVDWVNAVMVGANLVTLGLEEGLQGLQGNCSRRRPRGRW